MSRGYCLKWNKFNTIFQNSFGGLYANQELTDVTFFCEGQFIKCHRLVISAASQYFRDIFVKLSEPNPVVVLSDVKYNVFKALIDFIYCGEIQVHQDLLEAVVKAGEKFRVKGLNEGDDQNSFPSHTVELSDTDFDVQSSAKKRRFDEATTPTRRSKWGGVSPRIHLNEEVFVPEKLQQPITVNAKLGSRSDVKQELFDSIATNEDSFLREAESADFDTYDDTALDDDYEQGEVELEQPDFTLMTGSEDQDQTTTFGLGVEPQCKPLGVLLFSGGYEAKPKLMSGKEIMLLSKRSSCLYCSKRFSGKTDLYDHYYVSHNDILDIDPVVRECDVCGHKCYTYNALRQHKFRRHRIKGLVNK